MAYMDLFLDYLHGLPDYLIYFFLGLSAFVENLVPPIPGDSITAFGAFLVGTGRLDFFGVYVSTTLGSLLGFISLFWVGGYLGRRFFIEKDYRLFKKEDIIRAEDWFRKYGYFIISFNRFFPGIRSVISIASGITGLRTAKVIVLSFFSCTVWNFIWMFFGYTLGNNWETVEENISSIFARYNFTILILFLVFVLFLIIKKGFKR
ncbi:DedA family protein [Thermodesulfobacteriota bacterium]